MGTIYETSDGREFDDERDARRHANDLAREAEEFAQRLERVGEAAKQSVRAFYKPFEWFQNLSKEASDYADQENWDGAIKIFTDIVRELNTQKALDHDKEFIAYLTESGNDQETINIYKNFVSKWRNSSAHSLAWCYMSRSSKNSKGNFLDEAITDMINAVKIYPYNDKEAENYIELLGKYHYLRGLRFYNDNFENVNGTLTYYDKTISDFCIAIKLQPHLFEQIHNKLAVFYYQKADLFSTECNELRKQNTDNETAMEYNKQGYFSAVNACEMKPDGDYEAVSENAQILITLFTMIDPFLKNTEVPEDSGLQQLLKNISEKSSASPPKATTSSSSSATTKTSYAPSSSAPASQSSSNSTASRSSSPSPSSDETPTENKKFKVIGAIVGGIVGSFIIVFPIGTIIGAVAGWFLGGKIGAKFLAVVIILGLIGGGLYLGRPYIEPYIAPYVSPIITTITGKLNPSAQTETVITVMVITDNLNLRSEASGSADVIKVLKKGDVLTATGSSENGWLPVMIEEANGWVSSQYVE